MTRVVSAETRAKLSASMKGKRNALGKHNVSPTGREAIAAAQRRRWAEWRRVKEAESGG